MSDRAKAAAFFKPNYLLKTLVCAAVSLLCQQRPPGNKRPVQSYSGTQHGTGQRHGCGHHHRHDVHGARVRTAFLCQERVV